MSSKRHLSWRIIYPGLFTFIAYIILACIITWPLVSQIETHLPGSSDDTFLHYWNGWWVQNALKAWLSPFYTTHLFYPTGVNLVTHNIAWFNVLPWLMLEPLLDGIAAYNIALLLNLALCGWAMFWLTRDLTANPRAAFLAGMIYQTWPFRLSQLDHPNLLATQWIPLFFLFLIRTIRHGHWRDSLLAGLFFALIGYTRWQQLIPAALMGLIYFACAYSNWLPRNRRYIITRLIFAGALAVLALTPAIFLLLEQQSDEEQFADILREGEERIMQTDLMAYITPGHEHPLFGYYTSPLYDRYYTDRYEARRFTAYLGFMPLGLILIGVWPRRQKSLPWLLMAAFLILLALGPLLRINGRFYTSIPTFYGLLSPLGLFRLMRVPDRFNMFLALPVAVMAAFGIRRLIGLKFVSSSIRINIVSAIIGGLILFEYLAVPIPLINSINSSSFLAEIADESGNYTIMNLPFDPLRAKVYMFEQTIHQRPILQGNISRFPNHAYDYIDSNPLLNSLHYVNEFPPSLPDVSQQLAHLAQERINYILIHKNMVGKDRIMHWQRYLLASPRYEDDEILVYSTKPEERRDFTLKDTLIPGFGPVEIVVSNACLTPENTFEVDIGWGSDRVVPQTYDLAIGLEDTVGIEQQLGKFPLGDEWPAHILVWGYYPLKLTSSLPAGHYNLKLSLLDTETGLPQGKSLSIQPIVVQEQVCNLATDPEAVDTNALFGDRIRLLEYKARQEGTMMKIRLFWRVEGRMDVDYKVFVHIYDPATGIPIAQDDAMPHRGAYPTTYWWPGELIEDPITISLSDVPPGEYGIAVGIYEPITGERLALVNSRGKAIEDGRFILDETIIVK